MIAVPSGLIFLSIGRRAISRLQLISFCGQMRLSVSSGQRRQTLDGLRFDPGNQRAERQLDVTRRALAIPAAQAAEGDAEVPGEIEIGYIKASPRQADETVGHRTDRSRNGLIIVRPSIAFKRRLTRRRGAGWAQSAEE